MHSVGHDILLNAAVDLRRLFGEPLTFRGGGINAVVNRLAKGAMGNTQNGMRPQFEPIVESDIDVIDDQAANPPMTGESFKDESNRIHRILSTHRFVGYTRCHCTVSQ